MRDTGIEPVAANLKLTKAACRRWFSRKAGGYPTAQDQEWEFPYPPLWKRLREKARGRVLLADAPDITEIDGEIKAELSPKELERFKKSTAFEPSYVEYRVAY